jgi:Phosphoribosyl-ATP pyrophosphohydrolase
MKTGTSATMFQRVYDVILERKNYSPDNSYVASLMDKGIDSILKKIGRGICRSNSGYKKREQERTNTRNYRSLVSLAHLDGISGDYNRRYFTRTEKTVRSIWLRRKSTALII